MPTYEYQCEICGREFEKVQKISDDPVLECPNCGGEARRLISGGAGLLFKGSGFYSTDYRSDSYKKDAKKAAEKEKGSSKPSSEAGSSATGEKKGAKKNDD